MTERPCGLLSMMPLTSDLLPSDSPCGVKADLKICLFRVKGFQVLGETQHRPLGLLFAQRSIRHM